MNFNLPYFVRLEPVSLLLYGLTDGIEVSGIGLVTFGFLWPDDSIWSECDSGISTTWTVCA